MPDESSRSVKFAAIPDSLALGQVVRSARRKHGLTQTQLAGLAGTGLRFLSELERGKPNVAMDKTLAVLAVLGLHLHLDVDAEPPT